ncbi:UpxY family transcription antiterminator [Flavisolibacter nicotianae]|uniref:UpxY family transcription antiterminator n=1 Tax=Flavisolibacter nicotianae TaxID=2364882 RepID=UPI000EAD6BD2|nr:UpxY family transcription antiterminator [Flavisolibacter nicotianae]
MNTNPVWYAVYTKPKWEKKVAELLTRKGIENYCPLNKVMKQWHDRKKLVEEPLFTSYVFVCITPAELTEVKKTDGIINFVYWLGKPAMVREEEIETIRDFLCSYREVQLEKTRIKPEDSIQIINGPLMNREGKVLEVHQKTIKVILPSLGHALVAQVEKASVEVITAKETNFRQELSSPSLKNFKIA